MDEKFWAQIDAMVEQSKKQADAFVDRLTAKGHKVGTFEVIDIVSSPRFIVNRMDLNDQIAFEQSLDRAYCNKYL